MMTVEVMDLLHQKQVWEMSDRDLMKVKLELLRMVRKVNNEQSLREMCEAN